MTTLIYILFQAILTIILLRLSGAIGSLSLNQGYASMMRSYFSGNIAFNLFFRVLFLPISISLVSIFLFMIKMDLFVKNIWFVAIWYFGLQLILSFKKLRYTRLTLYLGSGIFSIWLTYIFYTHGITLGIQALLPQTGDVATELWLLIIVFFYGIVQNQDLVESYQDIDKKFADKYFDLKEKYNSLIKKEFKDIKLLNDLLFAVMIFEDFNRPNFLRKIERLLFRLGLVSTTGIMQIKNETALTDAESVIKAQEIILNYYQKYNNLEKYELIGKILVTYNPDAYYRHEVRDMFNRISHISQNLEENSFTDTTEKINGMKTREAAPKTINELTDEINSLIKKINNFSSGSKNIILIDEHKPRENKL